MPIDFPEDVVAIHEAGHAVVNYLLGLPMEYAELSEDVYNSHVKRLVTISKLREDPELARREIIASLGGVVAECMYTKEPLPKACCPYEIRSIARNDLERAHLIAHSCLQIYSDQVPAHERRLIRVTHRILMPALRWHMVLSFARVLRRRRFISPGYEIIRLLQLAQIAYQKKAIQK
ncbi:MAG: hypothetical protein ACYDCO_08215 [Armatimonadota bacterium]